MQRKKKYQETRIGALGLVPLFIQISPVFPLISLSSSGVPSKILHCNCLPLLTLLRSVTVSRSFWVFCDLDGIEEHGSNTWECLRSGFVWCFSHANMRLGGWAFRKNAIGVEGTSCHVLSGNPWSRHSLLQVLLVVLTRLRWCSRGSGGAHVAPVVLTWLRWCSQGSSGADQVFSTRRCCLSLSTLGCLEISH